jgi:hypothetical protein
MIKHHSFLIKKWFPNEKDALCAFYQKKIELHTPILVRYLLLDFEMKVENGKLIFCMNKNQFKLGKKEILISKIFPFFSHDLKKYFVLTNLGIFILRENSQKILFLTDLFLETTSGRLLFSRNIKNVLKQNI